MKKAFTLAEVLLTLTIIGVVAALTIPAVITKVTKDQYVVSLKKAYNTLKSVEREAIQEHGEMINWDWTGNATQVFERNFKDHFDILKICGTATDDGCLANAYTEPDGGAYAYSANVNASSSYKFITSDGISYGFSTRNDKRKGWFTVDVNGRKMPNRNGRDLFYFAVFPDYGIKPDGTYDVVTGEVISSQSIPCSSSDGTFCAAKILSEGTMNY